MKLPTIQKPLHFYNTESRKKELFKPKNPPRVLLYTCGPTVYNFAHIGNFRTYIFEDLLHRTLKFFNFEVQQVMNITDFEDKTIKGATEKQVSLQTYTEPFTQAFFSDIQELRITAACQYPMATHYIPQMIEFIQKLIEKGFAYVSQDGSVYYAIAKFASYGKLSHLKLKELKTTARVAGDEYDKENVGDFVLWKAYDPIRDGSVFWQSPFGKGRPGWHLECSTMAGEILGKHLDIHAGGVDNIFPHHENEIAQSEALHGEQFVALWMHSEHLLVDNKKMSKSLGNVYTLRDLMAKGFTGREIRYMLMQAHYRTQLNFTLEGLAAARRTLHHLDAFVERLVSMGKAEGDPSAKVTALVEETLDRVASGLADDLAIAEVLAALFDLIREGNSLYDQGHLTATDASYLQLLLEKINQVLAVIDLPQVATKPSRAEVELLLQKRNEARKAKDFALADRLRNEILQHGYLIEDTPYGAKLKEK